MAPATPYDRVIEGGPPGMAVAPGTEHAMKVIEAQLRECFGRVAYSHKTHEKAADLALGRLAHIKVLQILLSAITTAGLLAVLFGPNDSSRVAATVAAVVSTALLALNAYTKENDLGQVAQQHKETADRLWMLRESYLSLLTDLRAGIAPVDEIRGRRDAFQTALAAAYEAAPRTNSKSYGRAQQALKVNEDLTFSNAEIDQLLPEPLRSNRR